MLLSSFPSSKQALEFLITCGCNKSVIKHVQAVAEYGVEVAESCPGANVELVRIGGLFHDIGRCRSHRIDHGVVGAEILRRNKVDERIARIVERHVGAGITADEAAELGSPLGAYVPQTIEEKIVADVDNLIEDSKRVGIEEALSSFQREVKSQLIVDRVKKLHEEVLSRCHHSY